MEDAQDLKFATCPPIQAPRNDERRAYARRASHVTRSILRCPVGPASAAARRLWHAHTTAHRTVPRVARQGAGGWVATDQGEHNVANAKHPAMAALWPTLVVMGFQEPPRPPERAFSDYPTHIAHLHA